MTAHTNPAAVKPLTLSVTVRVEMTGQQLTSYGFDYEVHGEHRHAHVRTRLPGIVADVLGAVPTPLLADYSNWTVSAPRELRYHHPWVLAVTVKITMTAVQQEQWAVEYGLSQAEVEPDVRGYVQAVVQDALDAHPAPLLRDYSTYTVSQPR